MVRWWAGAAAAFALVAGAMLLWSHAGATPGDGRAVEAGRARYAKHCAVCHGESGRGDGPSASGFATKPTDLTDGRLINPLPDEFLLNVIRQGGPAEGLAAGMPPFAAFLTEPETREVIAYLRSLARPPFRPGDAAPIARPPKAPPQPILFSHLIHAGSFQIPCQYCHTDARRSTSAGLPSVERCMGCHKIIGAQDNAEIAKLHDYARRGAPIPWVRVFKVPEFTYFPHKAHVRAGVACQTCHGPVERMRVVGADTGPSLVNDLQNLLGFKPRQRPLTMGWCVDCHRVENATRDARAPLDCVTCHH